MSAESKREALRRKLVTGIVVDTGTRESLARPYVDAVMRVLDMEKSVGGLVYVPSPPMQHDVLSIDADLRRGVDPKAVCRRYGIGRRTLTRLFPGGIPRSEK